MATIREMYIQYLVDQCKGKVLQQTSYDDKGNLVVSKDKDTLIRFERIREKDGSKVPMYIWIGPKGSVKWYPFAEKAKANAVDSEFLAKMKQQKSQQK